MGLMPSSLNMGISNQTMVTAHSAWSYRAPPSPVECLGRTAESANVLRLDNRPSRTPGTNRNPPEPTGTAPCEVQNRMTCDVPA